MPNITKNYIQKQYIQSKLYLMYLVIKLKLKVLISKSNVG